MSYTEWNNILSEFAANPAPSQEQPAVELFDLTTLGVISIAGADAEKFLQGQLTADLNAIDQHQYRLSSFCNPKGRILSLFTLLKTQHKDTPEFLAVLPKDIIAPTIEALKKYAVFFQVTLDDHTERWGVFGLSQSPIEQNQSALLASQPWQQGYLLNSPVAQQYLAILPIQTALDFCQSVGTVAYKSYLNWQLSEIKAGIPRIYPETIGEQLPHYLDLPNLQAVSFEKGCYTGQEVIARMHYKGKLKSHLYYLSSDFDAALQAPADNTADDTRAKHIAPNSELFADGKKIGTVVSAVTTNGQIHLLAVCQDLVLSATKIQCNQENGPILQVNEFSNRTFDANI